MSLGAVLVVLIVSSAETDPAANALEGAARELLGQTATIRLVLTPNELPDTLTLQRAGTADGVVELLWSEDRGSALLHCYVTRDGRWVDRKITFSASDEAPERGRLLGFAIASMFPRLIVSEPSELPADSKSERSSAATGAPELEPEPTRLELELSASAVTGVRGPADAVGASLGLRLPLIRPLWLHAAVAARVGDIPAAEASTRLAQGALGLAWSGLDDESAWQLGLRADLLTSWLEVTRTPVGDAELESRSRWTFGAAALLEGGYRFSRTLGAHVGAGTELLLSPTDVYAAGQLRAKLPTFRIVGELGLRARF